jgi:phosphate starvation-inducible protein PhoH
MARKQKEFDTETRRFIAPRNKHQQHIVDSILFNPITVINGPAGSGKSNPNYTKVLTRDFGFVRIDSLEIGDFVIGQDGKPTKVLAIFPNDNLEIYEVTFSDGTTTRCCKEHLWNVKSTFSLEYENLTLEEIINESNSNQHIQFEIPLCEAIDFPEQKELDIHPYLLAYIISKGVIYNSGYVELTLTDNEYIKLKQICPELDYTERHNKYYCHTYIFDHALVRLGLNGVDSSSKFIPDQYLYNSVEQRLHLLNGFLDASNSIDLPYFYHFSIELVDNIQFLVQSLGGISTLSMNYETELHSTSIELPRSIEAYINAKPLFKDFTKQKQLHKYIVSTKYIGRESGRCILVDNEDHLFLLNDCIVTHNTLLSVQTLYNLMKSGQLDQIIVIRLITETCDEQIGSLPGEKDQKLAPFMGPIQDNLAEFLPPGEIQYLLANNKIEVIPVSFCRGRSFINKGVIIEEAQNLTPGMIITVATRIGRNSKFVFNGDLSQVDFHRRNGMEFLIELFGDMEDADVITLDSSDIQRHPMIGKIINRAESLRNKYAHQM